MHDFRRYIFHSDTFINKYLIPSFNKTEPTIFGYHVSDPERYCVIDFDEKQNILSVEEKPASPRSNFVVTGIYVFDKNAHK